jgi:hypothetical protein
METPQPPRYSNFPFLLRQTGQILAKQRNEGTSGKASRILLRTGAADFHLLYTIRKIF